MTSKPESKQAPNSGGATWGAILAALEERPISDLPPEYAYERVREIYKTLGFNIGA